MVWSDRTKTIVTATAVGAGAAGLTILLAKGWAAAHSPLRLSPFPWLPPPTNADPNLRDDPTPGLLDIDSEETDEVEPEGIVYDDDEPCATPPHPWDLPVAGPGPKQAASDAEPGGCVPPADLEPIQKTELPFAEGPERPVWPAPADKKMRVSYEDVRNRWHGKWGREVGAKRKSTDPVTGNSYQRVHVGVDLFGDEGDPVLAMEDGEVIATLPYYKKTGALYVRGDSGVIVNYGEIAMNSWRKYGIKTGIETGQRVKAGQQIAQIAKSSDGSHMLHIETFVPEATVDEIRRGEMRWIAGDPAPVKVLDPTRYLLRARQAALEEIV